MAPVVVCGAGVIGASVSYFLAQKGLTPTVVDAVGPACSASGKAGGFLARDWCDGSPTGPLAHASFALHADLADKLNGKERYGYRRMSTYSVSLRAGGGKKGGARGRKSASLGWLDADNLVQDSLIATPEDCAQVNPEQFTRTLLEESGAEVRIATLAGLVVENGAVAGVRLEPRDGGPATTMPADTVIIATGAWTGALRAAIPGLPAITGQKAHSIILADAAPGGLPAEALFLAYRGTDGKSQEPEIYPRPNGEVYVCGASTPTPLPSFADQVLPDAGAPARLRDAAAAASRHLAQAEVLREQACYLPCSPVGTPAIGPVRGVRGLYVAAGHSCWGILNAPATGLALAELIVDGEASCVSLRAFEPARAG
ncbi:hypothetical protein ACKKBG_A07325 [Auxenochlorella protothecoides x Auxenochlorella symbiontica]|uniref:FAD dependent oxidoreductase domain-containing protein n=1 Tax=Auxenochlorella protothecoides TaxID=3075 RepID=A0A1D2A9G8_AUXPR